MENRLFYGPPFLQVFDDNALEQLRRDGLIPDTLRIHRDDRTFGADAETRGLTSLHATGPKEQIFALEQTGQPGIEVAAATIR